VVSLKNEQGPGMGAAILAAVGLGWFDSVQEAADTFTSFGKTYEPIPENVSQYREYYELYKKIYLQTNELSHELLVLRRK
jgi:xylulokinase